MRVAYDVLVVLHAVSALIGFGTVAVSGAYGALGRRPGNSEEVHRYFKGRSWAEFALLLVPVFGVPAMAIRPGGSEFGSMWIISGFVIWAVASVLLLMVVRPAEASLRAGGPGSSRLMWAAVACDVLFVVALFLMVTQPR